MQKENNFNIFEKCIVYMMILLKYLISLEIPIFIQYSLLILCVLFAIVDIINKKINKKRLIPIFLLAIVSAIYVIFYQDVNFLISFLLMLICLKKNDASFIKSFFYSSIILFLSVIVLNILGILEPHNMVRYIDGKRTIRYSLGFIHPNNVFMFYLPIVLCGYYLYKNSVKYIVIISVCSIILYKLSLCRTGFYCVCLLLILSFFKKYLDKKNIKCIFKLLPIILTIFSIFVAIEYGYSIDNNISKMFSGRPFFWKYLIDNNLLFNFFGKNSSYVINIDNFYIFLLSELGIIGYSIYILKIGRAHV